jgi:AGCS family alanine or glycine:cation symporter
VLWTWIAGILGMATKYSEAFIAVKYRQTTPSGEMIGGTMYALEKGLGAKWAGLIFAAFTLCATFGIGSSVQSNSSTILMEENFGMMPLVSGIIFTVLVGLVLIGGIKAIGRVCERIVPAMAVVYIVGCLVILVINRDFLGGAVELIVVSAFSGKAAFGGAVGGAVILAMRYGIARGLFSNESGMGSASFLAAAARTKNPARQALVSMTGTFWDTVVICLITGLVLVSTMVAHPEIVAGSHHDGSLLTTVAFAQMGSFGPWLLTFGLLTFSVTTMIGWSYYGDRSAVYLFGEKAVLPYRLVYLATILAGAIVPLSVVWNTADVLNGLMAVPNLICVIMLSGVISRETRDLVGRDLRRKRG